MAKPTRVYQLRVDEAWERLVAGAITLLRSEEKAAFVREAARARAELWRHSPYVSLKTKNTLYVSETGCFYYRRLDELWLNSALTQLPSSVTMKHPKIAAFLDQAMGTEDASRYFQRLWRANWFAAWAREDDVGGRELCVMADTKGLTSKEVTLALAMPGSTAITRESIVVIDDYVNWCPEDSKRSENGGDKVSSMYDGAHFVIDVPTLQVEISVVVDARLFARTLEDGPYGRIVPKLRLRVLNREEAPYHENPLDLLPGVVKISSFHPKSPADRGHQAAVRMLVDEFTALNDRIAFLAKVKPEGLATGGGPRPRIPVPNLTDAGRDLKGDNSQPSHLFYRVVIPSWPHMGLTPSIEWVRPLRPTPKRLMGSKDTG